MKKGYDRAVGPPKESNALTEQNEFGKLRTSYSVEPIPLY